MQVNLAKYRLRPRHDCKSGFQHRVGQLLTELFPQDMICEEVVIPGERFVLDFLVRSMRLVVECQGRQHDGFIPYFHGTRQGFHRQQDRDRRKREWCELNDLKLVEIPQGAKDEAIIAMVTGG